MSLSSSGISNFSVVALTSALRHAALGRQSGADRLSGGAGAGRPGRRLCRRPDPPARRCRGARLCDQCRHRAMIGLVGLGAAPLIVAMAAAGFLGGLIMPSRDMLVRAAAPPGAVGRTFGVVTTGFNFARHARAADVRLHHGPGRAALGVPRQHDLHDRSPRWPPGSATATSPRSAASAPELSATAAAD